MAYLRGVSGGTSDNKKIKVPLRQKRPVQVIPLPELAPSVHLSAFRLYFFAH
jgi:hypothetical protein